MAHKVYSGDNSETSTHCSLHKKVELIKNTPTSTRYFGMSERKKALVSSMLLDCTDFMNIVRRVLCGIETGFHPRGSQLRSLKLKMLTRKHRPNKELRKLNLSPTPSNLAGGRH